MNIKGDVTVKTNQKYLCPYCNYDKVEIVLASYHCDNCKSRISVYNKEKRDLYQKVEESKHIDLSNVLYSQDLSKQVATFVIDDVCVKHRSGPKEDLSEQDIQSKIKNYDSIGVQIGRKVNIYCDDFTLKILKEILERQKPFNKKRIFQEENIHGLKPHYEEDSYIIIRSQNHIVYFLQ